MPQGQPSWRQSQTLALKQAIQTAALRLIAERGYAATTVGMVADEVGIAERTCYRHFPAKPEMVLWDAADHDLLESFRTRPADEGVITAFREALRSGYGSLTREQRALDRQRNALIAAVPEIRAAHVDHLTSSADELVAAVADRARRAPDDPEVVAVSGAVLGIMLLTAQRAAGSRRTGAEAALDAALARLEEGFGSM